MGLYTIIENHDTKVFIWKIEEPESFFIEQTGLVSFIKSDIRRIEFLAGRFLLKKMMPQINLHEIIKNAIGKPILPDATFHFSISHSYPYIAVALDENKDVGVDIQIYKEKIVGMQSKFLNYKEIELASDDYKMVTLFWSVKEALYKWKASGGQDFSDQLIIRNIKEQNPHYNISCSIINEEAPDDYLELKGILFEDFSFALSVKH